MAPEFSKVGVVGVGVMGAGIVEVLARNGIEVVAVVKDDAGIAPAKARVDTSVARAVARGKMDQAQAEALAARVTFTADLASVKDCDLVIEAVPDQLALKQRIFADLEGIVGADTVLATNTSALSLIEVAVATKTPSRVVGMHFFNPVPVLPFVEVVRSVITSNEAVDTAHALAEKLGKQHVSAGDRPGFIVFDLTFAYLNHAVQMYENKYATREDIDAAMQLGCGLRMGPLLTLDLIGLDTAYEVLTRMYEDDGDRLHAPRPILKQMIAAGLLGRKTGRGFYTYAGPGSSEIVADAQTPTIGADAALPRSIEKVGVVGSGTMATGIVEVFAKAGYDVVYVARGQDKVDGVTAAIAKGQQRMIDKGRLTQQDADAVLARLTGSTTREDLKDVDIVVEAIAEDLAVKQELFRDLDRICKPGAILATTTSSLPIIQCAMQTSRPGDVIGMHFFNPAQVMRLIEVVDTVLTDADVVETTVALSRKIGKHPVQCGDRSGFIVNALLFPYLNEAIRMLEGHYATADDIDTAMRSGTRYPMGPFELLDVVGLDVSLAIQNELYTEFHEPGFKPAPLLEHLVTAGYLGRKTKKGFRNY
ncbi:MAG: 3-hydroxybutyryl-CoA dehydrogenase [Dermatophilaceae bacterium]